MRENCDVFSGGVAEPADGSDSDTPAVGTKKRHMEGMVPPLAGAVVPTNTEAANLVTLGLQYGEWMRVALVADNIYVLRRCSPVLRYLQWAAYTRQAPLNVL